MSIEKDTIKFDSKNNIIIMKTYREGSAERMKQAFNQILELSEIENCKNVLVDAINTTKLPPVWKLHNVGTYMSKEVLRLIKMRVAFVGSEEISNELRFLDTVLSNRMVNIRFFKNVDDAKKWLENK